MDPDTDIETRTFAERPRRASRAPWDPPPRPAMPSPARRRKADGDRRLRGAEPLGGYDDDMDRGAD